MHFQAETLDIMTPAESELLAQIIGTPRIKNVQKSCLIWESNMDHSFAQINEFRPDLSLRGAKGKPLQTGFQINCPNLSWKTLQVPQHFVVVMTEMSLCPSRWIWYVVLSADPLRNADPL